MRKVELASDQYMNKYKKLMKEKNVVKKKEDYKYQKRALMPFWFDMKEKFY
jgi:hypothetical protein